MSLICMCNICGKTENMGPIVFNNGPMMVEVENFKGEKYNVKLNLEIQHADDAKVINEAKSISKISSPSDLKKIDDFTAKNYKIKHPKPHICTSCIKEISYDAIKNGKIDPKYNVDGSVPISFVPEGSLDGIKNSLSEKDGVIYGNSEEVDSLVDLIMEDLKSLGKGGVFGRHPDLDDFEIDNDTLDDINFDDNDESDKEEK